MAYKKKLSKEEREKLQQKNDEKINSFLKEAAEKVTAKILEQLKTGKIDAIWDSPSVNAFFMNPASNTHYNLENSILLSIAKSMCEYEANNFVTFNQAKAAGCHPEKGSKGHHIVQRFYVKKKIYEKNNEGRSVPKVDDDGNEMHYFVQGSKLTTVFNVEQLAGDVPKKWLVKGQTGQVLENEDDLQFMYSIIEEACPVKIRRHDMGGNYYIPVTDTIHLMQSSCFKNKLVEASTTLHEWGHATGHKERLDRETLYNYHEAKHNRGYEELVANFTARHLCNHYSLSNNELAQSFEENHDTYDSGWGVAVLKKDPMAIFHAAYEADKASRLIVKDIDPVLELKVKQINDNTLNISEFFQNYLDSKKEKEENREAYEAKQQEKRKTTKRRGMR